MVYGYTLKYDVFSNVISKLVKVSKNAQDKVLLKFTENKLQINYATDVRKSTDIIDITSTALKPVSVAITLCELNTALDWFKARDGISADCIQIGMDSNKLSIKGSLWQNNNDSDKDNSKNAPEKVEVVQIEKDLAYTPSHELTRRDEILLREDFDSICNPEDYDVWDRAELLNLVKSMLNVEGRSIIYTTKVKTIFSTNQVYSALKRYEDENKKYGWILSAENARVLVQVLGNMDSDEVKVTTKEGISVIVADTDGRSAYVCELTVPTPAEIFQLNAVQEMKYPNSFYVNRSALLLLVDNLYREKKSDACVLSVDGKNLKVENGNKGVQKDNNIIMLDKVDEELNSLKIGVSIRHLRACLSCCTKAQVCISVYKDGDGITQVRISDKCSTEADKEAESNYYLTSNL
jgi:hypothetical protein